jgi:hypothetical protein
MSDSEEDYDDSEEEEEEEDSEGEEGEEGAGEDEAKTETVKEDIAMLMDIFGYIDRTSKRLASRLDNESLKSNSGAGGGGNRPLYTPTSGGRGGGGGTGGEASDEEPPHELNGGWSQYEYMGDADRGLLLEKAILALGINDNAEQMNDRQQYAADGNSGGDKRAK